MRHYEKPYGDDETIKFQVLCGIVTIPSKYQIRMLIRHILTYEQPQKYGFDVQFILDKSQDVNEYNLIIKEKERFHDIIILNNQYIDINAGKIYDFFNFAVTNLSKHYDFIMKIDDDTYVHYENLYKFILNNVLSKNTKYQYFGFCNILYDNSSFVHVYNNNYSQLQQPYLVKNDKNVIKPSYYMGGPGYILSTDIIKRFQSNKSFAYNHKENYWTTKFWGSEDVLTAIWIIYDITNKVNVECLRKEQYGLDYKWCLHRGGLCKLHANVTKKSVIAHQMKTEERWINSALVFYPNLQITSIQNYT